MLHESTVLASGVRIEQVALINYNVPKVVEGLHPVHYRPNGGEGDVSNLLLSSARTEDGRQVSEGPHLMVILHEDLLRWLKHQHRPIKLVGHPGYHDALAAAGGQNLKSIPFAVEHMVNAEADAFSLVWSRDDRRHHSFGSTSFHPSSLHRWSSAHTVITPSSLSIPFLGISTTGPFL